VKNGMLFNEDDDGKCSLLRRPTCKLLWADMTNTFVTLPSHHQIPGNVSRTHNTCFSALCAHSRAPLKTTCYVAADSAFLQTNAVRRACSPPAIQHHPHPPSIQGIQGIQCVAPRRQNVAPCLDHCRLLSG
jgi:hypothetical protein